MKQRPQCALILSVLLFFSAATAKPRTAFNGITTPKPGSAERCAILDALRPPVEKEVGQHVVFYDVILRVKNGWAYVSATGLDEHGHKLKRWAPEVEPSTAALLRRQNGKWRVLSWGAATDASPQSDMRKMFPRAPRSLFPSMPDDFSGDGPMTGTGFNNHD